MPVDLVPLPCTKNLSMAIVDMEKNNNLGEVVLRKKIIIEDSLEFGKLTATKHANGRDWWLITQKNHKNLYYKVLLTPQGATIHDKQIIGNDFFPSAGQTVFSPDGKYYINFDIDNDSISPNTMIFDFDRCTGQLSNTRTINYPNMGNWSGGIAVSPNSHFLYVSLFNKLYQYDLRAKDILTSEKIVGEYDGFVYDSVFKTRFHTCQLAPNGKIYIRSSGAAPYMHVINHPDLEGKACNFVQRGLKLPFVNTFSVPNHPNYRLGVLKGSPCDTLNKIATQDIDNQSTIKIYPNPAQDILNVQFSEQTTASIVLRSTEGKELRKINTNSDTQLDISDLYNGLIFVEIWIENRRVATKKVVIMN